MTYSYHALAAELAKPAYSGLGDAAAADLLNAPGLPVQGTVTPQQLLRWGAKTGVRLKVENKAADPQVGSICLTVRDLLTTGTVGLDTAHPDNLAMVDALVASGVMTAGDRTSLLDLGASPGPSVAARAFGAPVTADDVLFARSLT